MFFRGRPTVWLILIVPVLAVLPACTARTVPISPTTGPSPAPSANATGPISQTTPPATSPSTTPETTAPAAIPPSTRVVGYITHWHINRLPQVRLDMLTHLIWQGVEVTSGTDPTLHVSNDAGWEQIPRVAAAAHDRGIKMLVSLVGPWDKPDLSRIWESPPERAKLVAGLVKLVEDYNLDGIDIDNESTCEPAVYDSFLKELHESLAPLGKIITLAANPNKVCLNAGSAEYLDFINLMTYDMYQQAGYPFHSTLQESIKALKLWADAGLPKDKLLMGIPFYGRDGDSAGFEYSWIVDNYHPLPGQNHVYEPSVVGGVIWWNGIDLVKQKVGYARDNGFGGIMVYEVAIDKFDDRSLLKTVFEELRRPSQAGAPGQESR